MNDDRIPAWATLGVKRADAWNKLVRYSVTPAYANATFLLTTVGSRKVRTRDDATQDVT